MNSRLLNLTDFSNMDCTCENGNTVPYAPCENLFRSSCVGCSKRICVQHLKRHKRLNGEIWEQGAVCLDCSAKAVVSGKPIIIIDEKYYAAHTTV